MARTTALLGFIFILAACVAVMQFVHSGLGGALDTIHISHFHPPADLFSKPMAYLARGSQERPHVEQQADGPLAEPAVEQQLEQPLPGDANMTTQRPKARSAAPSQEPAGTPRWAQSRYTECRGGGEAEVLKDHQAPYPDGVEVVITWHCDRLSWLHALSPDIASFVSILILHKVDDSDMWRSECKGSVPDVAGFKIKVVRLPNCGRDVHSVFAYTGDVYARTAAYTMFMQADQHWFVKYSEHGFFGFKNNADAINRLSKIAIRRKEKFLPVGPYKGEQPILFEERESNIEKSAQDEGDPTWLRKYDHSWPDMWNQQRDTLSVMFGKKPCDYGKRQVFFVPGFQFVISREAILFRPQAVWQSIAHMTLVCHDVGYGLERAPVELFNSTKQTQPLEKWTLPVYCPSVGAVDDGSPKYFSKPDAYHMAKFWRQRWGCEPLSPWLQDMAKASVPPGEFMQIPAGAEKCSWSIGYDVWYGPPEDSERKGGDDCLIDCCNSKTCVGVLTHQHLDSQCYWFTELPKEVRLQQVVDEKLETFSATKKSIWSFIWKRNNGQIR